MLRLKSITLLQPSTKLSVTNNNHMQLTGNYLAGNGNARPRHLMCNVLWFGNRIRMVWWLLIQTGYCV